MIFSLFERLRKSVDDFIKKADSTTVEEEHLRSSNQYSSVVHEIKKYDVVELLG